MNMGRRNTTKLTAAMDSLAALIIVVAVVIWANQQRMPQGGLAQFLQMRITLLNASFSIVFTILWKECLESLGLYRGTYTELTRPALVAGAGCGLMTAVLALYLQARHAQGPVGHILAAFFVTSFAYGCSAYCSRARACAGPSANPSRSSLSAAVAARERPGASCESIITGRSSSSGSSTTVTSQKWRPILRDAFSAASMNFPTSCCAM